jgi:hypothetical protein
VLTLTLLSVLLSLAAPCAAEERRGFGPASAWENPGAATAAEQEMFSDIPYVKDWQSRSFYFVGRLDDGLLFVINLFRWQFSFIRSWGLGVIVTDGSGKVFSYEGSLPEPDASRPAGFHFSFPDILFDGSGGQYRVRITLPGFSCDLLLNNILGPWKPGSGMVYFTEQNDFYNRYTVPSPWAQVEGQMTALGRTTQAHGQCFWDSTISATPLSRPNTPMYVFRAFSPPGAATEDSTFIDMLVSYTDPSFGPIVMPMLLVARGGAWAFTARDFSLTPDSWRTPVDPPYPYPGRYRLSASGGGYTLEGDFTALPAYHVTDIFARIPRLLRGFVSAFLRRPVIYRMLGSFDGLLRLPDGSQRALSLPGQGEYVIVK